MSREGSRGALTILETLLGSSSAALPFARSVVAELTGLGPLAPATVATLEAAASRVAEILLTSVRVEGPDQAAIALLAEPAYAAAFFQNLDLLYEHSYPHSDAVSAVMVRALELATEAESSGTGT